MHGHNEVDIDIDIAEESSTLETEVIEENIEVMVSMTDKLVSVNTALEKDDCSLVDVIELLAAVGAEAKTLDMEVLEMIEIVKEIDVVITTLAGFVSLASGNVVLTEAICADAIVEYCTVEFFEVLTNATLEFSSKCQLEAK